MACFGDCRYAFTLLTELARGCPDNNALVCELLLPHHMDGAAANTVTSKSSSFGFYSRSNAKSSTG